MNGDRPHHFGPPPGGLGPGPGGFGPHPGPQFDEHIFMIQQMRRQLDDMSARMASAQTQVTLAWQQAQSAQAAASQAKAILSVAGVPAESKVEQALLALAAVR